jgi:proteasome lid subunit RPN8/RPN11
MLKSYILRKSDLQNLHLSAVRAQKRGQREVCGVLASDENGRLELRFLTNRSERAGRFRIARTDYLIAREAIRRMGKRVLGIFHSHPISEAIPGRGDLLRAALNSFCLIYDVCGRKLRLWKIVKRDDQRTAKEVPLKLRLL